MLRYAITDRAGFEGDEQARQSALVRQARRWSEAGIEFVQLREKDLGAGALAMLARRMQAAIWAGGPGTKLLINSRVDVALAVGAAGVHLRSGMDELTVAQVRGLCEEAGLARPVVSVSCHTVEEVGRAREDGVDLILFGPVFEKWVGGEVVSSGVGLAALGAACAAGLGRVIALGGVTGGNTEACVGAGAAGVAGIRLFGT
jgi:thiamine-phosphate pyrophosphorylase